MATPKKSSPQKSSKRKPATAKRSVTKTVVPAPLVTQEAGPRRVKTPRRRLLRRQDKRFKARPKLPNSFRLTRLAYRLIASNWKVIGGMVLLYGLLNIILVRGINGGANVSELKSQVDGLVHGATGHITSGLTVFGLLLTSSNNVASSEAGAYQTFLLIIISLAVVWAYRQLLAGSTIRIRDGFYRGMYPLIPALVVLLVIGAELIPLLVGVWLYTILISQSIAITGLEQAISFALMLGLITISLYLLCSTVFALYIATLPDMTPIRAMRSARELVRYRRWPILRKLLFLPLALLVIGAIIMLPCILFIPVLAQWVFFVLSMAVVAVIHAYMYMLYRELLNE